MPNQLNLETQWGHFGGFRGSFRGPLDIGGGGWGVTNSKVRGRCQTAGPIDIKFGTHVQIHLGMDIRQTNCPERHKEALGGFRGSSIQKSGKGVKRLDRLAPTLVHVYGFIWEWHRLNTSHPSIPQGACRGGGGG